MPISRLLHLRIELVEAMLNELPSTPFFVKDRALRFVAVNDAMVRLSGARNRGALIGKRSRDFFPGVMATRGEEFDREVLESRAASRQRLDVLLAPAGPVWLLFRRWPVLGERGEAAGVASIARRLDAPDRRHPTFRRLSDAIASMQTNVRAPLQLTRLAKRAGTSASQFERDFVTVFGVTPRQYLTTLRIETALKALKTNAPVAQVALESGFSDQSAFTRRFVAAVGLTPTQYRRSLGG